MAFEKKPLQDGVKTKLKDYSVDLEDRIGSAIDEGSPDFIRPLEMIETRGNRGVSMSNIQFTRPLATGMYLLFVNLPATSYDATNTGVYILTVMGAGFRSDPLISSARVSSITISSSKVNVAFTGSFYPIAYIYRLGE